MSSSNVNGEKDVSDALVGPDNMDASIHTSTREIVQSESVKDTTPREYDASTSDVPDGGLVAWLQVAGSFSLFFNSWGIVNTFGAFQTYYEVGLLSNISPSAISWIGSLQGFLLLLFGVLTGPVFDMGYLHTLLAIGTFLIVFGLMMTSLSTQYYQVLLAQGVCMGLGSGCIFVPSVAIVATYFNRKRSYAIGIAASGSSIGAVVYTAVFHQLQPRIGFGWATRVMGFLALGTLSICFAIMRIRVQPRQRRQLLELSAFKEPPYALFTAGLFLAFAGLYIPFFYISSYAGGKTGANSELAFYFVSILNASSVIGRLIPNFYADKIGPLNMLLPCIVICSILAFFWIPIHNVGGLAAFAVLYGFFSGSIVSLPPSIIPTLSPDLNRVGTRMGMVFAFAGLGLLIGTPIAGALLNVHDHYYVKAQIFCGAVVSGSVVLMTLARTHKVGTALRVKA